MPFDTSIAFIMPDDKSSLCIHKLRQASTRHTSFIDWWEQAKIDLLTSNDSNYSLRSFVPSSSFISNGPRFTVKLTFILPRSSRFDIVKRTSPTVRKTFKSLKLRDKAKKTGSSKFITVMVTEHIAIAMIKKFWPRVSSISGIVFPPTFFVSRPFPLLC